MPIDVYPTSLSKTSASLNKDFMYIIMLATSQDGSDHPKEHQANRFAQSLSIPALCTPVLIQKMLVSLTPRASAIISCRALKLGTKRRICTFKGHKWKKNKLIKSSGCRLTITSLLQFFLMDFNLTAKWIIFSYKTCWRRYL